MVYKLNRVEGRGVCKVHNAPPSKNHSLKDDFYKFSGNQQYHVDFDKKKKNKIKSEIYKIFEAQDEYLKLQFESVKNGITEAFEAGDENKMISIVTSPYLPESVQVIAQLIYDKYTELMGE